MKNKYFKVKVFSQLKECIVYEKDFQVVHLFERFIRGLLPELVRQGKIPGEGNFSARIIPKYDAIPQYNQGVKEEKDERPYILNKETGWLDLIIGENIDISREVKYFHIMISSEKQENGKYLVYSRDFRLSVLNDFMRGIDTVLCSMGIIIPDDLLQYLFYACIDDKADFSKDKIYKKEGKSLFEITPKEKSPLIKKVFHLNNYTIVGKPQESDIKIIITSKCQMELEEMVSKQFNPDIETGGILIGDAFEEEKDGQFLVEIDGFIPARYTEATMASLLFTHESWNDMKKREKEEYPGKKRLGWFHTHPFKVIDKDTIPIFFSQKDAFIHKNLFKKKWQIAMVLGYAGKQKGFFQWNGNAITSCGGYYISNEDTTDA